MTSRDRFDEDEPGAWRELSIFVGGQKEDQNEEKTSSKRLSVLSTFLFGGEGHAKENPVDMCPGWGPLIPLNSRPPLPMFPTHTLGPLEPFVREVSTAIQVDESIAALAALTAVGSLLTSWCEVEGKENFRQRPNLYTCTVLASGGAKSPVIKEVRRPLEELQKIREMKALPLLAKKQLEKEAKEARLGRIMTFLKDPKQDPASAAYQKALADATALKVEVDSIKIVTPRIFLEDFTPEVLGKLLGEHRSLAVITAEAGVFDMDRYSDTTNLDIILKAYDGEYYQVDRIMRAPVVAEKPLLSIAVSAQPKAVARFVDDIVKSDRGLTQRFLYAAPPVPFRDSKSPAASQIVLAQYRELVFRLGDLEDKHWAKENPQPKVFYLDDEALLIWHRFTQWEEKNKGDIDHPFAAWASKLWGTLLRLSLILHMLDPDPPDRICRSTVERAEEILKFCWQHTRFIFRVETPTNRVAQRILDWALGPTNQGSEFSLRQVVRALARHGETSLKFEEALSYLVQTNHLQRIEPPPSGKRGRPPGPRFTVRPSLLPDDAEGD